MLQKTSGKETAEEMTTILFELCTEGKGTTDMLQTYILMSP